MLATVQLCKCSAVHLWSTLTCARDSVALSIATCACDLVCECCLRSALVRVRHSVEFRSGSRILPCVVAALQCMVTVVAVC